MRSKYYLLVILLCLPVHAQEKTESLVTLELLYQKPFAELYSRSEGFPPAEIKQILKRDDIPQEDKDWLLNSLANKWGQIFTLYNLICGRVGVKFKHFTIFLDQKEV